MPLIFTRSRSCIVALLLGVLFVFTGCFSTPKFDEHAAKLPVIATDNGRMFFQFTSIREEYVGILVDGQPVRVLFAGMCTFADLKAGVHEVTICDPRTMRPLVVPKPVRISSGKGCLIRIVNKGGGPSIEDPFPVADYPLGAHVFVPSETLLDLKPYGAVKATAVKRGDVVVHNPTTKQYSVTLSGSTLVDTSVNESFPAFSSAFTTRDSVSDWVRHALIVELQGAGYSCRDAFEKTMDTPQVAIHVVEMHVDYEGGVINVYAKAKVGLKITVTPVSGLPKVVDVLHEAKVKIGSGFVFGWDGAKLSEALNEALHECLKKANPQVVASLATASSR